MEIARCVLDRDFRIGAVDPRLFGTFVEHMGRCVYTGIHEPDHPTADRYGFRGDVADLVRELGATVVRYPGGNFVSGYRWEDGVGPVEDRPTRLDLAWRSLEPNTVGLNELVGWARRLGLEPMVAVNLGTRGIDAARALVEYANHPSGTYWSDLRIGHGVAEPHDIRLWCLGNELDGPWQIGHKTADEYGRLAVETAKAMRQVDPRIELVACGSSHRGMPTFGAWEATVLGHAYDEVDYVSLHAYYEETDGDRASFLASALDMDAFIDAVVATCDHVAARRRSAKRLRLSFDEWNVWYLSRFAGERRLEVARTPRLIEDTYGVVDAVVVGSLLMTLLDHADRVAVGCQAQLVNVIAPIRAEPGGPSWRQPTFHPFALTARYARGQVLRAAVDAPRYPTARHGDAPLLALTATHDEETGGVTLLAVNRDQRDPLTVETTLRGFGALTVREHLALADPDPAATNTPDAPSRVVPRPVTGATLDGGVLTARLPPLSWNLLRLTPPPP
ncbi:MAG: alpha-N-arabinofuranosidase [Mycobacteriales bacterium]